MCFSESNNVRLIKMKKSYPVKEIFKDMQPYIDDLKTKENHTRFYDYGCDNKVLDDNYVVGISYLYTKETRILNKQLNI